jgi:hypothetical protein
MEEHHHLGRYDLNIALYQKFKKKKKDSYQLTKEYQPSLSAQK